MDFSVKPTGVCPSQINFTLDGDKVSNVSFVGGCNGNLKCIASLIDGQSVDYVAEKLEGITCGFKKTSCGDQLVKALKNALAESSN